MKIYLSCTNKNYSWIKMMMLWSYGAPPPPFLIIILRLFDAMKTSHSPQLCLINWSNEDILFLTIEHFMIGTWWKCFGMFSKKKERCISVFWGREYNCRDIFNMIYCLGKLDKIWATSCWQSIWRINVKTSKMKKNALK